MCGNFTIGTKPKFWVEGEELVARTQVIGECSVRIGGVMKLLDNEAAAFKGGISFVGR